MKLDKQYYEEIIKKEKVKLEIIDRWYGKHDETKLVRGDEEIYLYVNIVDTLLDIIEQNINNNILYCENQIMKLKE